MPAAGRRAPRSTRPGLLRIGHAARAVGVSPSTLRLWERQGLVTPLRPAGEERRYGPDQLTRLRCIRRLRAVEGLNAAGIRRALGPGEGDPAAGPDRGGRPPAAARQRPGAVGLPVGRAAGDVSDPGVGDSGPAALAGARLRALRTSAGLSLRAVAARTGLSPSFLSGLERGTSGASMAALERLAAAHGTSVAAILEGPAAVGAGPGPIPADRVVRGATRKAVEAPSGVRIEELRRQPGRLRPRLVALAPGAASDLAGEHQGEAFLYVLEGRVAVWLADLEHHELGPGDALTVPASLPNRFAALGAGEARILWIATPPRA
jgi:DNA-binding transcriptional MerR regulator/transcriptional regulator with XRE-family HTH domain